MRFTLVAVLLAVSGCGDSQYDLLVRFEPPGTAASAERIEVALVAACGATPIDDPAAAVRTIELRRGEASASLGEVPPGTYGLHGRAFDGSCAIVAAGCEEVTLVAGGSGTLELVLHAMAGPGCDAGERCASGTCVPTTDGGREEDSGVPVPDGSVPADAGPPPDDAGLPRDGGRPPTDGGMPPMDAGPGDGGAPDGGMLPSCVMTYGGSRGFILCEERPTECEFYFDPITSTSCDTACMAAGGTCLTVYNEATGPCVRGKIRSCAQAAIDHICVCTR